MSRVKTIIVSSTICALCSIDAHHPHPLISHHLIRDFNPAAGEVSVPAGWIEQKREGRKLSEVREGGGDNSNDICTLEGQNVKR